MEEIKKVLEIELPKQPKKLHYHVFKMKTNPAGIYLSKLTMCEICSNLAIETPGQYPWHRSGVFIVYFRQVSHIILMFSLLT